MRKLESTRAAVLAALMGLVAGPAAAANLDISELGAAAAFPVVTGGFSGNEIKDTSGDVVIPEQTASTLVTLTNATAEDVLLKLDLISGDRNDGDGWQSTSLTCLLTGRETTTLVFHAAGTGNSKVYVECSRPGDPQARPTARYANLQNGILFAAVADPDSGEVVSEDAIFGDAIVVDTQEGQAYSMGGISFQAGEGQNDGNMVYRFDGAEYSKLPSVLATNFIAPTEAVNAELILFTLDGTVGNLPTPRVKVGGFAYNDDEVAFDFTFEFDCFDIVALDDINENYRFVDGALGLGSLSGHLEMVPQPIASGGFDVHDAEYGDANNVRRRGVHGWIVQNVAGTLVPAGQPVSNASPVVVGNGPAAWGRALAQSTTSLLPFEDDDDSVLDTDVRN